MGAKLWRGFRRATIFFSSTITYSPAEEFSGRFPEQAAFFDANLAHVVANELESTLDDKRLGEAGSPGRAAKEVAFLAGYKTLASAVRRVNRTRLTLEKGKTITDKKTFRDTYFKQAIEKETPLLRRNFPTLPVGEFVAIASLGRNDIDVKNDYATRTIETIEIEHFIATQNKYKGRLFTPTQLSTLLAHTPDVGIPNADFRTQLDSLAKQVKDLSLIHI